MIPATAPAPILPETVDENAVRRLCGAAVFAEADKLQRAGHVLSPTIGEHGPEASVRGTWRRVDHTAVQIKAGRLSPSCTRDSDVFCRHVGALLLQCLRSPDSLSAPEPPDDDVAETTTPTYGAPPAPNHADESPVAELARLLDVDTANHLRQIAKNRGVRLTGNRKADIVQQLTSGLMEPASIDQAIARLNRGERQTLDVAHLLSAETPAQETSIQAGIHLLGGTEEPPFDALLDSGLFAVVNRYAYGPEGWVVPRTVAARLPPRSDLARHASDPAAASAPRLGIIETIQVIAQASLVDPIHRRQGTRNRDPYTYLPPGFIFDPAEKVENGPPSSHAQTEGIRLLPPRLLADDNLARLRDRTGQPIEAIDFIVRLLVALQIAHTTPEGVAIRFDRLQTMLDSPAQERLAHLMHAWLASVGQTSLGPVFGPNGPLTLRWHPLYATWITPLVPSIVSAAHLVARLVGRMSPEEPYDLASFVETVERLIPLAAPGLNQLRLALKNNRALSMTARIHGGKQERLVLGPPEGWTIFLTAVVTSLLTGPLTWLGFVEVVPRQSQPLVLRIRAEAGVLVDRFDGADTAAPSGQLTVSDDLTVLVPPAVADVAMHGLLARAGQLIDASRLGLRYRLTAAGVQAVFDTGMTGPEFTHLLADRAGGALPAAVRKELDRWWRHYGTIRLYDEVTVIELSDDFLLAELSAATSLASAIVETFSPRLIAIDGARAEEVIAELAERGYGPRVIEES